MSNIQRAFQKKAFIAFLTAGDPSLEKSEEFILEMAASGADLIEIGIPFSDPIAEGPVIQRANIRALAAGATLPKIFDMVAHVRQKTQVPLVFLTYLNPVFQYGFSSRGSCGGGRKPAGYEAFFARCRETGIDGIIIPDLPFEEQREVRGVAAANGVDLISLIAPTSERRIAEIAGVATGFLYIVSSMGVTGIRAKIETDLGAIIKAARSSSKLPVAVGFGISTPEQATDIAGIADGVIVGSAIVKLIEEHGKDANDPLRDYVKAMKAALG